MKIMGQPHRKAFSLENLWYCFFQGTPYTGQKNLRAPFLQSGPPTSVCERVPKVGKSMEIHDKTGRNKAVY